MKIGTIAFALLLLLLIGCTAGDIEDFNEGDPAGFWFGLWHGAIAFFTLIISIFTDTVRMYEIHNTGFGYDLGFFLGFSCFGVSILKGKRR